ncbi:MAG: hypothetical protein ACFB6R_04690 [Alphaproteobacteria bacterium]
MVSIIGGSLGLGRDLDASHMRAWDTLALARGGQPDEITAAALYCVRDHAGDTTGALLRIDGRSQ